MTKRLCSLFPLAAALALAACGEQELHRELNEEQANAIVAALAENGIDANKSGGDEGTWTVGVADGDFAESVSILREQGLPGENFVSLGEVFEKEGFTSSPLEERARLIFGLSQELSQTVSAIDGVVQARVHLTLPEPDPLSNEAPPSSASVFVKYRPGFQVENQTGAIKTLVANSIEGISYDRVSVVMVPAAAPVAPPEADGLAPAGWMRVLVAVLAILLALAGGWRMWQVRRSRGKAGHSGSLATRFGRSDG
ncbi:type III secretion system inner membrane ring lipoprotein SctJ [Qipengyuania qiaonensis]|uniref:Lipoprotein n=1 Tax=Qipengyuania qiaonensis TaxID=2867240 RepID=A0ABS7J5Y9_9SPHN|nr:type III secretion inner membrane ring lipoprotein SctJ [Qipengyuania qiaonensis]MBX7482752.1 type III secretion inner membrane ring lipoprotein SctJ [Qipengyuania qiaonensis]